MRWLSTIRNKLILHIPSFLFFTFYSVLSVIMAIYYSFTDFKGLGTPEFIGFRNYSRIFSDAIFLTAFNNTLIILVLSSVILLPLSFAWAYILDIPFKGNGLVKVMSFTPYVIAPIIVGTIWLFILDPEIGLLSSFFRAIGKPGWIHQWIGGDKLTPYSVTIVWVWQTMCFHSTIMLAGLKSISHDIYEAASVDGAGRIKTIFFITLPLMKETFITNIALQITGGLKIFEVVNELTGGGPNHKSETLITYMYSITFSRYKYGYGMSLSVLVLIISAVFSIGYIKNARQKLSD